MVLLMIASNLSESEHTYTFNFRVVFTWVIEIRNLVLAGLGVGVADTLIRKLLRFNC